MEIKTIFEDKDLLVVDKPSGVVVFPEGDNVRFFAVRQKTATTLIGELIEKYPELKAVGDQPRYGIVHRLDKDTSGVLLVAKSTESLIFLQNQFINREVEKKYTALAIGDIKEEKGEIKTLIGRAQGDKRKQKVYTEGEPGSENKREAITEYKVIEKYESPSNKFTLLEVKIKTGRKHQIRCHLSYIQHPIAGDKMYGFKNSPVPKGLTRQFLHAGYLKIKLPGGEIKEFKSDLPEELEKIINNLARQ